MHQHRPKGHHSQPGLAQGEEQHARPEGSEDDAHVLHRGISQNPLDIFFHGSIKHPQESGNESHQHDHQAVGKDLRPQELEDKAAKAVDSHLQHDAAHKGGHMAGSRRMGIGQPHMERHQAGLQGKTNKGQSKSHMAQILSQAILRQIHERQAFRGTAQEIEGSHDGRRAQMGHDHVLISRLHRGFLLILMVNQQEGGQRHHFPGHQKGEAVPGNEHQHHGEDKEIPKPGQKPQAVALIMGRITQSVNAHRRAGKPRQRQEEPAPKVSRQTELPPGSHRQEPASRQGKYSPAQHIICGRKKHQKTCPGREQGSHHMGSPLPSFRPQERASPQGIQPQGNKDKFHAYPLK